MKIRQGLVSNSSSSSFAVVLAKVIDEDKFKKWNANRGRRYQTIVAEEILTAPNWELYQNEAIQDFLRPLDDDFQDCLPSKDVLALMQKDPYAKYFLVGEDGPDGDSFFTTAYDDLDYDRIDLCDFSERFRELFRAGEEEGLDIVFATYYAGRDG